MKNFKLYSIRNKKKNSLDRLHNIMGLTRQVNELGNRSVIQFEKEGNTRLKK